MPSVRSIGHLVLVVLVVAGMTVPAAAVSIGLNSSESTASLDTQSAVSQNNSSVNVTVGQQLSTIITASSDEVQTEFENTAFELSYEREGEEGKAEAIADRAEELRERAADIREDYREATGEYEEGEISKSQYAQRLATLNARATNLLESYELLQQRAANVSALELRAAGLNQSALQDTIENLSSVSGAGPAALLKHYTGESEGKIELKTAGGLSIEIESEDGEESREIERPRDDDQSITVNQSVSLDTARAALSTPATGSWVLVESKVKQGEGAYEFAFRLEGDANRTGQAEVLVDGSTGTVFKLEEEIEPLEDEEDDEDEDEEDEQDEGEEDHEGELALIVAEGTPAPNATITLLVLADGDPSENVTVYLNEQAVGQTAPDGTMSVTLPASGDVELTAETEAAEGELEIEFEDDDEQDEVFEHLNVEATLDDDTVTVVVTFNGSSVRNATVYANDGRVGETDASGTVTLTIDTTATEELELEVVKGQFEAELAYAIQDGSLVLTEEEHEGDGDKAEQEDEDGDEQEDDDDEAEGEGEGSLSMAVVEGTAEPGATITVEVRGDGEPVEGATVTVNGDVVGPTDADGTLEITLPSDEDSIELRAEHDDADGRLEFEFDDSEETETETEEG